MPSKMRVLRRGTALTRSEKKQLGPVQIVVLGFDDLTFQGDILPEYGASESWRSFASLTW